MITQDKYNVQKLEEKLKRGAGLYYAKGIFNMW